MCFLIRVGDWVFSYHHRISWADQFVSRVNLPFPSNFKALEQSQSFLLDITNNVRVSLGFPVSADHSTFLTRSWINVYPALVNPY